MGLVGAERQIRIWNRVEQLPVEEKRQLQAARLRRMVDYAYRRVPFYRQLFDRHGVSPEHIRALEDLSRIPFTRKSDLVENYPFGFLAVDLKEIVRLHATSGTTGRPVVIGYTEEDLDVWAEAMARTFTLAGVTAGDVIQNAFGYGLFTGGLGFHMGAEAIKATLIPIATGLSQRQVMLMRDLGTTVLTCTPSYALTLADTLAEMGMKPQELRLRVGIHGAEPWTDGMRQQIEERLGLEAFDNYGLTEMFGPAVATECHYHQGLHVQDDLFYPEVVDPASGEPLPPGEVGELVLTSLARTGMPLLRYRTRDLTALIPEPCPCGRTTVRIKRIVGRVDDMLVIRGVNVFPSQIETVLMEFAELAPHYQIIVDRPKNLDTLEVQVEATEELWKQGPEVCSGLAARVRAKLTQAIIATPAVTILPPGRLPRIEQGKARRVIDRRNLGNA